MKAKDKRKKKGAGSDKDFVVKGREGEQETFSYIPILLRRVRRAFIYQPQLVLPLNL